MHQLFGALLAESMPNPYEVPSCQEIHYPCERFLRVFRFSRVGDVSSPGRVLTSFLSGCRGRVAAPHTS